MINSPERAIITIEDPVEYEIENIRQIQVNSKTGLSFSNGLRSILRQDPNIIMVGEIRDSETARIAVNTSLTGHLLLSTLHTNDAGATLPRLLDMGIEEYLVASTLNLVIGQRLVRKICEKCKETVRLSKIERESLKETPIGSFIENGKFYKGRGCEQCGESGYFGRICINEVLVINEMLREAILRKASLEEIQKIALQSGMTPLVKDGIQKALQGKTTIEEILRIIYE